MRFVRFFVACAGLVALTGCGGSKPVDINLVTAKVEEFDGQRVKSLLEIGPVYTTQEEAAGPAYKVISYGGVRPFGWDLAEPGAKVAKGAKVVPNTRQQSMIEKLAELRSKLDEKYPYPSKFSEAGDEQAAYAGEARQALEKLGVTEKDLLGAPLGVGWEREGGPWSYYVVKEFLKYSTESKAGLGDAVEDYQPTREVPRDPPLVMVAGSDSTGQLFLEVRNQKLQEQMERAMGQVMWVTYKVHGQGDMKAFARVLGEALAIEEGS
ncbi:MAG: hypothetical protein V2A58_14485 [Planctomycetota bacterium]